MNFFSYIRNNTLSISEFTNNIAFKLPIDIFLEKKLKAYGDNIVASAGLREAPGILVAASSAIQGIEIGNSGKKYDIGNFLFALTKTTCKNGLVFLYSSFVTHKGKTGELETIGRIVNYFCDPLGRPFAIASINRQDENKTSENYFKYFYTNVKFSWFIEAYGAGILKIIASDYTGEFVKIISWRPGIKLLSNEVDTKITQFFFAKNQNTPDMITELFHKKDQEGKSIYIDIWEKFAFNAKESTDIIHGYIASAAVLVNNILGKIAEDSLPSFSICLASRSVQNFFEPVIRDLWESKNSKELTEKIYNLIFQNDSTPLTYSEDDVQQPVGREASNNNGDFEL